MALRLHPYTQACLWCTGIAAVWNGVLFLLWQGGSDAFYSHEVTWLKHIQVPAIESACLFFDARGKRLLYGS